MIDRTDEDQGTPDPGPDTAHGTRRAPAGLSRWLPLAGAGALVLLIDQVTKAWAFDRLCEIEAGYSCAVHAEPVHVIWTLQWNLAFNTGMAFSQGAESGPIIAAVVMVIVGVLLFVARRIVSRVQLVLIGVVLGGALGNLVDRLVRAEDGFMSGAVVDFVDVQWWPIWNVADMAVVVGGIALALTGFTTEARDEGEAADGPGEPVTGQDPATPPPA
jgi:signal peptidase II